VPLLDASALARVRQLLAGELIKVFVAGLSDLDLSRLAAFAASPPRVTGQLNEFVDVSLTTRCCVCARGGEEDAPLCTRLRSRRDTHGLLLGEAPSREQLEQWPLYAGGASWMAKGHPGYVFFACTAASRRKAEALSIQAAMAAAAGETEA